MGHDLPREVWPQLIDAVAQTAQPGRRRRRSPRPRSSRAGSARGPARAPAPGSLRRARPPSTRSAPRAQPSVAPPHPDAAAGHLVGHGADRRRVPVELQVPGRRARARAAPPRRPRRRRRYPRVPPATTRWPTPASLRAPPALTLQRPGQYSPCTSPTARRSSRPSARASRFAVASKRGCPPADRPRPRRARPSVPPWNTAAPARQAHDAAEALCPRRRHRVGMPS